MNSFVIWNSNGTNSTARAEAVAWLWLSEVAREDSHVGYAFSFGLGAVAMSTGFKYEVTKMEYQYSSEQRCACKDDSSRMHARSTLEAVAPHLQTFEACCSATPQNCLVGREAARHAGKKRRRATA